MALIMVKGILFTSGKVDCIPLWIFFIKFPFFTGKNGDFSKIFKKVFICIPRIPQYIQIHLSQLFSACKDSFDDPHSFSTTTCSFLAPLLSVFIKILQGLAPTAVSLSCFVFFWKGYLLAFRSWDSWVRASAISACQEDTTRKIFLSSQ